MINRKHKKTIRTLSILALIPILFCMLSGCKSHALKPEKQALLSVGNVGEYQVPYEDLYFLAASYDKSDMSEQELRELIYENVVTNYAILTLCDRVGVEYDQKVLDDAVQSYLDSMIASDFGGDRSKYLQALEDSGMTDHYVRFTLKVDLIYEELEMALAKKGEIAADEKTVIGYVKENFVRTRHFMIANNQGDDTEANLQNAQKALSDLRANKTNMFKLIGGALNEDLLIPYDGYVFARGSMEKEYEDAAFELEIGEFSEVVSAKGELASGESADCYYVIERIAIDDEYIDKHYDDLYKSYVGAVIAERLEQVSDELEFVPNEYGRSLNLKSLTPIDAGTDVFVIVIVSICIAAVVLVALTVTFFVLRFKKKKAAFERASSKHSISPAKKSDK